MRVDGTDTLGSWCCPWLDTGKGDPIPEREAGEENPNPGERFMVGRGRENKGLAKLRFLNRSCKESWSSELLVAIASSALVRSSTSLGSSMLESVAELEEELELETVLLTVLLVVVVSDSTVWLSVSTLARSAWRWSWAVSVEGWYRSRGEDECTVQLKASECR